MTKIQPTQGIDALSTGTANLLALSPNCNCNHESGGTSSEPTDQTFASIQPPSDPANASRSKDEYEAPTEMMPLEMMGQTYRVLVTKDACGDSIIKGRNGLLYMDGSKILVCFTDDPSTTTRKRASKALTRKQKTFAVRKLGTGLVGFTQEGDSEFIAEIRDAAIATALFGVLKVRRFMVTKGISKPFAGIKPTTISGQDAGIGLIQ